MVIWLYTVIPRVTYTTFAFSFFFCSDHPSHLRHENIDVKRGLAIQPSTKPEEVLPQKYKKLIGVLTLLMKL